MEAVGKVGRKMAGLDRWNAMEGGCGAREGRWDGRVRRIRSARSPESGDGAWWHL